MWLRTIASLEQIRSVASSLRHVWVPACSDISAGSASAEYAAGCVTCEPSHGNTTCAPTIGSVRSCKLFPPSTFGPFSEKAVQQASSDSREAGTALCIDV